MGRKAGWRSLGRLALVAASILSSCFLLTEGQGTDAQILLQPKHPIEGQNVTLIPQSNLKDAVVCRWYRGWAIEEKTRILNFFPPSNIQNQGSGFTGREKGGPGCTLHIMNLTSKDSGNYTFSADTTAASVELHGFMIVSENLTSPILEITPNGMVKENTTVTLNCLTSSNTEVSVSWFKDGKPLPAGANFLSQNRTLILNNVTKNESGSYTCQASNIVSNMKSNPVNVTVAYGPDIKLNPEGTIEKILNSNLKLECFADSVPAAQFQWFFNNAKRDANRSIFHVQLTNWTDEGNYSCQATNPFSLQSAMKTVYVKLTKGPGGSDSGLSGGAIAGIVIGSLAGVALISGLLYFICTKTGRTEQPASNGNVPSAPGHNKGVTDTKPKVAEEDLQYSILAFKDNNRSPPPRPNLETLQPSDGVTIYSEIKKK